MMSASSSSSKPSHTGLPERRQSSNREARDQENLQLARYHANLIKQQAETEAKILAATETLLDFPRSDAADPLFPSEHEAREVKSLLRPFQPTDYDALIQERNIDGRCGYVLCPRKHRSEATTAKYRIVKDKDFGRGAFRVVDRADLEKWCSDACGKHALYLRVQLLETPAWERRERQGHELLLFGEGFPASERPPPPQSGNPDVRKLAQDLDQLALERGDKPSASFRSDTIHVEVKERSSAASDPPPSEPANALAVDGYVPNSRRGLVANFDRLKLDEGEDDFMDTI